MIRKLSAFALIILMVFLIPDCKKTVTDTETYNLILQFDEEYIGGPGWIVLNSLDGKKVIRCFPIENKREIKIKYIKSNTVTFSLVTPGRNAENTGIQSFYEAPTGTWKFFSAKGIPANTPINLNLTFPENGECRLEVFTNFNRNTNRSYAGDTTFQYSEYLSHLDEDTTFSILCSLFNDETKIGYYDWLLNQKFIPGEQSDFHLNLTIPYETKSISIHKEFYTEILWIELLADLGISSGELSLTPSWTDQSTLNKFELYFANSFPANNYIVHAYIPNPITNTYTSYKIFREEIPDEISIPSGSFTVLYGTETIRNIHIEGDADAISSIWALSGGSNGNWKVVVPPTTEMFSLPVLPDSINEYLFGSNIRDPRIQAITMHSYKAINNYPDYCQKVFMSGKPLRTFIDDQYEISIYNIE